MNILYKGLYKFRFKDVINLISKDENSVIELCFGDIYIAKYCKENNNRITGLNLRKNFGQDNAIMAGLNQCSW